MKFIFLLSALFALALSHPLELIERDELQLFKRDDINITIPDSIVEQAKKDQAALDQSRPKFTSLELYEHALLLLHTFLSPNNLEQAEAINSTYFSEDVRGRIDITRNYDGRELNTEYLFGLFVNIANSHLVNIFGYAIDYDLYEFNGNGDQYSFSVIFTTVFPLFNNQTIPFEANIYVQLNSQKQISQYDLQFKRWDRFFEIVQLKGIETVTNTTVASVTDTTIVPLQKAISNSICEVHEEYCTDSLQQYDSFDDCVDHLNSIPFGKSWEGGRDTVFCRSLHQNMVSFRPEVHCSHIGPSGGDMCINEGTDYETVIYNFNTSFDQSFISI